jgi:hypothetical protein
MSVARASAALDHAQCLREGGQDGRLVERVTGRPRHLSQKVEGQPAPWPPDTPALRADGSLKRRRARPGRGIARAW